MNGLKVKTYLCDNHWKEESHSRLLPFLVQRDTDHVPHEQYVYQIRCSEGEDDMFITLAGARQLLEAIERLEKEG